MEEPLESSFKRWARLGYGARGVVYLVIGGMALLTALGQGGDSPDSQGAMLTILRQPFGKVLILVMIIGLLGYVVWRFLQAVRDPDRHGRSVRGLAVRAGLLVSSVTHLALAIWATGLIVSSLASSNGQDEAQGLLATAWGQAGLAIAGLAVIGAGLAHIYKGWSAHFERYMSIPPDQRSWAQPVCRFGLIARGLVWLMVGWFLIDSARNAYHDEVAGMADALAALREASYGPWLLGAVAAGLFAFGVYSLLEAMYRRIRVDEL